MKQIFFYLAVTSLLAACSSSSLIDTQSTKHYSGGQRAGDSVSLFWYTEINNLPAEASDRVYSGKDGEYRSSYYWNQGKLQEILRKGEQQDESGKLVPFSMQLRFSQNGEAVYQLYRIDGKVLPIQQEQIQHYEEQALNIVKITKGTGPQVQWTRLVQGYWDGETFESCDKKEYSSVEFNQTLPTFVIDRLASLDNYLAVLGTTTGTTLKVDELLVLADEGHDCLDPVDLRSEQQ